MEDTPSPVIPCSGPCRKRFRPDAISMDARIADAVLAYPDSGLAWFCPECRTASSHAPDDSLGLPTELLVAIFKHLPEYSLRRVRSVCHRWREIVDQNRCLWNELGTYFKGMVLDRLCAPENLIRGASVLLDEVKILGVGSWWSWFGEGLTALKLYNCDVGIPVLVAMLRETPNLNKMILSDVNYTCTEEPAADFRLEKFDDLYCDEAFDVFGLIFPRLRRLRFQYQLEADEEPKVCRLLETVQNTLQDLNLYFTARIVEQMAGLSRLRLTHVHIGCDDQALALKIIQLQPSIVDLVVTATSRVLWTIAKNLPQLSKIHVCIKQDSSVFVPAFLVHAPNLTSFFLSGKDEYPVNFGIPVTGQNLKQLSLNHLNLQRPGLSKFLTSCTDLQQLVLYNCALNSWHDLFGVNFRFLQTLKLFWTRSLLADCPDLAAFEQPLTTVDIHECNIPTQLFVQLMTAQCFQRLKNVSLRRMDTVNDEVVRHVFQLPQLEQLYLSDCSITDASEAVVNSRTLRRLKIIHREPAADEETKKLLAFFQFV